jgi:hypothetical protein
MLLFFSLIATITLLFLRIFIIITGHVCRSDAEELSKAAELAEEAERQKQQQQQQQLQQLTPAHARIRCQSLKVKGLTCASLRIQID